MLESSNSRPGVTRLLLGSVYVWLLLGCTVTLLAMWLYPYLPEKRLELLDLQPEAYIYADDRNAVNWVDQGALRWRCVVREWHNSAFCGFNLALGEGGTEGLDLSQYSELRLEVQYRGPAKSLRYYFRNSEPGFSRPGDPERDKFMQSQISVEFLNETLVISLDEFYVAEWWLTQYEAPRALSRPNFRSVTAFGIDLAHPVPEGEHIVHLQRAGLVGTWVSRDQWYGAILGGWVLLLAGTGLVQLYQLRKRLLLERERRDQVMQRNRVLREQSEEFRTLSRTDQLTGLLNRQGISIAIEAQFAEPQATPALMVVDIDHFKPINDRYGHDVGDQVLKELGTLLNRYTRQSDFAARWGGEEFVLLMPETSDEAAEKAAEKLRRLIAETPFRALGVKRLTVSIGYGVRQPGEAYHSLFRRVDKALYSAKRRGRNLVCFAPANA